MSYDRHMPIILIEVRGKGVNSDEIGNVQGGMAVDKGVNSNLREVEGVRKGLRVGTPKSNSRGWRTTKQLCKLSGWRNSETIFQTEESSLDEVRDARDRIGYTWSYK